MERAGHKKIETSIKYYIAQNETMRQQALRIINTISLDDPVIKEYDFDHPLTGKKYIVKLKASGKSEWIDPDTGDVEFSG